MPLNKFFSPQKCLLYLKIFSTILFILGVFILLIIGSPSVFSPVPMAALTLSICGWSYFCSIFFDSEWQKRIWEAMFVSGSVFLLSFLLLLMNKGYIYSEIWREILACSLSIFIFVLFKSFIKDCFYNLHERIFMTDKISAIDLHEAGHVCVSALHGGSTKVKVKNSKEASTICAGQIDDKVTMLQIMAGQIAEEAVFGFGRGGSLNDMRFWNCIADKWLEKNNFSKSKKPELIYRQRKYLLDFFYENFNTLLLIAKEINKKGEMNDLEIAPYLEKIKFEDYSDIFDLH